MMVNLIHGSLCKCDLNAKYNDAGNCGECILFSFFFSLVSTVFLACLFVTSFSNIVSCSLAGSFPGIILNKCEQFCSF